MSTPTSATGKSTDAPALCRSAAPSSRRRSGGFTLLELLIVVTIIGLFAGIVVLSGGLVRGERDIDAEVLRLRSLIELVREEAIMQSREFAVLFAETGYRFYVYDQFEQRWVEPAGDRLLAARALPDPIRVDLRVEARDIVLEPTLELAVRGGRRARGVDGDDIEAPQPHVLVFSSGEMTAFEADFYRDLAGGRITLTGDIDGSFDVRREGFDGA